MCSAPTSSEASSIGFTESLCESTDALDRYANGDPFARASDVSPGFTESSVGSDMSVPQMSKQRSPPAKLGRFRNWMFTVFGRQLLQFGESSEFYSRMATWSGRYPTATYVLMGYEFSKSGQSHIQGFIQFPNPRQFTGVARLLAPTTQQGCHAHVETCISIRASIEYCKKAGSWEEFGTAPAVTKGGGIQVSAGVSRKRKIFRDLVEGADPRKLICLMPEEHGYIQSISRFATDDRVRSVPARIIYIWGDTGVGKTTTTQRCLREYGITYHKKAACDRWFDGYNYQPVIIFDEFTGSLPVHQFNIACDGDPPRLEIKGSTMVNVSTHYILLSNRSPDDQYAGVKETHIAEWRAYRRRVRASHHCQIPPDVSQDLQEAALSKCRSQIHRLVRLFVSDLGGKIPQALYSPEGSVEFDM